MFEKVSMYHPDKLADRIAGAIVDYAYSQKKNPKVAVEVLLGHGNALIINETDTKVPQHVIKEIVERIVAEPLKINYVEVKQDEHLAKNQENGFKCGDNGIFKGVPTSEEEKDLTVIVGELDNAFKSDGKAIIQNDRLTICQSKAQNRDINELVPDYIDYCRINPLGYWEGGTNVDSGATNRKLGSDMGRAITGGGIHGKDLTKADASINLYLHKLANELDSEVLSTCAIGDEYVKVYIKEYQNYITLTFTEIVEGARAIVKEMGGFEKLAEYGLIR